MEVGVGQHVFRASPLRVAYDTLSLGALSAFLVWVARSSVTQGPELSRFGIAILAFTPLVHLTTLWRSPKQLTLNGEAIDALFWSGRRRRWRTIDLRLQDETMWSRILGFREIIDRAGKRQFRLWKGIDGYSDFCLLMRDASIGMNTA
jgi:hypothetical protein